MTSTTSGAAFATATAAMIRGTDGASTVHVLLADCLDLLDADTAGVLVRAGGSDIELLAATSHQARDLELYQSQSHSGPCIETIEHSRSVEAAGEADLLARWPDFGRAMTAAGFLTVHTSPMRWHDNALGGVNLFWRKERQLAPEERELAQAFADICTLALMQPATAEDTSITQRLLAALQGRVDIERAKGVLAETENVDTAGAFDLLVQRSKQTGRPLSDIARAILRDIVRPR